MIYKREKKTIEISSQADLLNELLDRTARLERIVKQLSKGVVSKEAEEL